MHVKEDPKGRAPYGTLRGDLQGLQEPELIHRNRGVNGQFYEVFERNMRKERFNNQVPGGFMSWSETHCTLHQLTRYWHGE